MQFASRKQGIVKLVNQMRSLEPERIVVEATGGYEETVVLGLYEAGLAVALVSPQRVHQFARAKGLLAKTDQLDAGILAEFGQQMQPRLFVGKSKERRATSCLGGTPKPSE